MVTAASNNDGGSTMIAIMLFASRIALMLGSDERDVSRDSKPC